MKIALVIDHLDPRRGGAEQWTFQHAERLLARGHEVHVVAQGVNGPAAQLDIVPHLLGQIRSVLHRAAAAAAALQRLQLDTVHDIGLGWHSHVLQSEDGSRLAQWEQKLLLLPSWQRPWKRAMLRVLPRYRDFRRLMARQFGDPQRIVIAVSQMCARDYQRYHDVPAERIRLVYHGTDNQRFSPAHRDRWREEIRDRLGVCEDEVMLLFVGHDFQRKGLSTAIRAANRLAAEGAPVRLVVVGGKKRRPQPAVDSRNGVVIHVGAIDDPVPYYAAADIFVLPTFYDPCSLSVSEAVASGLPSVTTRYNGAAELLTEGVDGSVISDPADDAELAGALRPLFDRELRQRMGEAARKLALKHTLDRNCDQILSIYQQIAGRKLRAA
ncbi:MAG: glycosyltransferase family 4 protein [Thermoguttaceae bacterium]